MTRQPRHSSRPHRRSGLAPLELTLTLPFLAIMMALMINFGVIGAWKIRTQGNAHYAAFRSVYVRTGQWNPNPPNWPNAKLSQGGGNALPTVGQLWDSNVDTAHPRADWVRGSFLTAPNQQTAINVEGRLEFNDGVHSGTASMQRPVPLMRGATRTGKFGYNLTQSLLDNRWQFHSMGIGDNWALRTYVWWDIGDNDLAALDQQIAQYYDRLNTAQQRLLSNPRPQFLYPLDRDIEFQIYNGSSPNFYPGANGCSVNVQQAQMTIVGPMIDRINRLPCDQMASRFTDLYREWIRRLEKCGADDQVIAPLRTRYNDLRQLINSQPRSICGAQVPELVPQQPCDPMDATCFLQNRCPAPIPDTDGL